MLKLYRRDGGVLRYWETWQDGKKICVHRGVVGTEGEHEYLPLMGVAPAVAMERAAAAPRAEGFAEVLDERLATLVIQYRIDGMGTVDDLDVRHEVEDLMNHHLGWTGNGHCDGGDIGSGTVNVFCYVVDAEIAARTTVEALRSDDVLEGAVIAVSRGEEDFEVVWPKGHTGGFALL